MNPPPIDWNVLLVTIMLFSLSITLIIMDQITAGIAISGTIALVAERLVSRRSGRP